ncbi:histone deacetylase family protein [Acuticoccus sp. I52.16.1]|uniref:histone deacetylase family protein n=1 Tax=Acuticoccus sp. I52.16.1 TaxID=2928472 RepID=UPI001FD1A4AE|nr:histone deacetylase family protein [Acuticoccus sp. I52.16.1]UOM33334.1 histone deacetylase family protein [Acuticoccus sp. I52.16.1]
MTLIYTDPVFGRHKTPPGHPECAERFAVAERALAHPKFEPLPRRTAAPAPDAAITAVHPAGYLAKLDALVPEHGLVAVDADTSMGPSTMQAARVASGALMAATDALFAGEDKNAFVIGRPPGHHAEHNRAMGFCFLNHVAIAARHAQRAHGVGRVAIVDFDVHHGNGTQDIFWDDASVLYISTHQSPLYPGTGEANERGVGNILNVPLPPGTSSSLYRTLFDGAVMPALNAFEPEFLILSAGFDAHEDDPLGGIRLTDDDFVWITQRILEVADRCCGGRVVSSLEGGYDLAALGRCVAAHVSELMSA